MKKSERKYFHFISHTHWDREWYLPFESFRMMLVELIDDLISLLENNPNFRYFHLDGQTIVLEDYLKIRPENATKLTELIQQKRIAIGPWYVLPDEFLVSGESLIRNLLTGHQMGSQFGDVIKVGYVPDSFGHISQLPQILAGFEIENVILWRGVSGAPNAATAEYRWKGPDDTTVLMIHLSRSGYRNAWIKAIDDKTIIEFNNTLYKDELPRYNSNHILCLNGGDHLSPFPSLPYILTKLTELSNDLFIHSRLDEYMQAIKPFGKHFPEIQGEHRSGYDHAYLLQGVYSSRIYLKQKNESYQTRLERYAEPLNAFLKTIGTTSYKPFLDLTWKYLLQNQPHDSVCGCSIDAVHREMMTRFEKCEQIVEKVVKDLLSHLHAKDTNINKDIYLSLLNPSPFSRTQLVEAVVDLPVTSDDSSIKPPNIEILDAQKNFVFFQILNCEKQFNYTFFKYDGLKQNLVFRYSILIDGTNLTGLSLTPLRVRVADTKKIEKNRMQVGRFFLENTFVRVEISEWGVIKLIDKLRDQVYLNLNIFEDTADAGDEYNYSFLRNDEQILSKSFKPRLSVVESGPLRGAIRIRTRMKLPQKIDRNKKCRSKENGILKLSSIVYLDYNSPLVYFKTDVHNTIEDHRLRVLFQTDVPTNKTHAESPFHITTREHRTINNTNFKMEIPSTTHPMKRFVTVTDGKKGLTLFSKGLPEYEFSPERQHTLALTLLRCLGRLSGDDLITRPGGNAGPPMSTPEAQCQGKFTFEYAILPHGHDFKNELKNIYINAEYVTCKPIGFQSVNKPKFLNTPLLTIKPDILQLSIVKETEDGSGILVRLYNPSNEVVTGSIQFTFKVNRACLTNLNEEEICELKIDHQTVKFKVKPWQIISCKFYLN